MDKQFNPRAIETKWYESWEADGHFAPSEDPNAGAYCVLIPPPNVTGSLHMGHAFQDTIMDALTRYQRMRGARTLWQPGTDHAGIATQMVVERQLAGEGTDRHQLGREAFVDRVWQWKAESGGHITRQLRRLGASVDWARERFTMDEGMSAAVTEVFVRLYEQGLIYRGQRLVNWDPVLHTAISDLEVISTEEAGHLWHFRYPLADGTGTVSVATTRPETMLGDTAVAVHPEDERYAHLVGKAIVLPLAGREIPVVADDYVDPEFGSGCVKITPAHDFNDYAVGERHSLARINIFHDDASLNDNAPSAYRGLDRYQARQRIVADLDAAGLVEKIDDHRLMVPRGDRSGSVVEPYLTDQWFVRAAPLAEPAIAAVADGRIRFVPENWDKTYFEWMKNIQDWCISRQLWWGHRIPAWYDDEGNIFVGRSEDEVREKYASRIAIPQSLRRDSDVLDTWFSSALWPFSTMGWPENTEDLRSFYPSSVLVTGFDIIFFWVARMVMMGLHFMGDVPFREVYVHGLVKDADGVKMSKSRGNVLDPIDLIDGIGLEDLVEKRTSGMMQPQLADRIAKATRRHFPDGIPAYGTDALRFTFAALASQGRDIRFDLGRVEGYRNFCNKLWNAARFVLMNSAGQDCGCGAPPAALAEGRSWADRWIVSRLQRTEGTVQRHIESYRFDLVANELHDFIWHQYCDWYLELVKPVLNDETADPARQRATRHTLVHTLETALRLLHPLCPFITEEIWQGIAPLAGKTGGTIMRQPFPTPDDARLDPAAEAEVAWLQSVILGIRQIRGEMNIPPRKPLPVLAENASAEDQKRLQRHAPALGLLASVESLHPLDAGEQAPPSAAALAGSMKLLVPMAGLIDKQAELMRLDKQLQKLDRDRGAAAGKLDNPNFADKAPAKVVQAARRRLGEIDRALTELRGQRERIAAL
ncbi:MAG: valine--tRNA ligase [Salinisphaera sp.]|nr:valine--tRNA ligase [Salinisphaera sp.]